ncbi:hypothetical protein KI809_10550 [Geobacter pelophilus]|uniref:Transcriptional regulator n=1 Tax=Geoanaerobacter pelophilus TaxID=60036 RepID=A0AAW4L1Z2_9BACT|nr:hypothetical protein [Geoanaerobacter pelophilus]MBT0664739.1 hypothetical protein [Geoanaerobacter pelophilus]
MNLDPEYVLGLLQRAVIERNNPKTGNGGQKRVGDELGCSGSLVNQLLSETYPNPEEKWYPLIVEHYGNETVQCPTLGEIPLIRCTEERNKPAGAPSAFYARQRRTCRNCPNNGGAKS